MEIETISSSSTACCYIIESQGKRLIIECGVPLKTIKKTLDFDLSSVAGCLISHEHLDHCRALFHIDKMTYWPTHGPQIKTKPALMRHNVVEPGKTFYCGSFAVKPISLQHDAECFGYIIRSEDNVLLYATDTGEIDYNVPGLTHLMIEANHSLELLAESDAAHKARAADNHLDIDSAIRFALSHKKTLREIHLLHLSDRHSDERKFKQMAREALGVPVYVAQKGAR